MGVMQLALLQSAQPLQGMMSDYMCSAAVQMYFENAYCINCWYKDLDQPFIKYPPFVIHYAGCQMCTGESHWPAPAHDCHVKAIISATMPAVRI